MTSPFLLTSNPGPVIWSRMQLKKALKPFAPDDLAKLSKVKAKLELILDYADMEKVRDILKGLSKA
jgi:hypothetical protein